LDKKELDFLKRIRNEAQKITSLPYESNGKMASAKFKTKDTNLTYEVNGKKREGYDLNPQFKGEGPKTELQDFQEKYRKNKEFREDIDKQIEAKEASGAEKKKAAQAETMTKLRQDLDEWLQYRKLQSEGNIQQEITDIQFATDRIVAERKRDAIGEKEAQEQIRAYRTQTATLTKQLRDKEREDTKSFLTAVKEGKSLEIQALEERLEKGENVEQRLINKVKERLDLTLKGIDREAEERIRKEGYTETAKQSIIMDSQNKRLSVIKSEADYLNGVLAKAKQEASTIQSRLNDQVMGFKNFSAFGTAGGPSANDIPSISGFSGHIDVDGSQKKEAQKKKTPVELFGDSVNSTLIPATAKLSDAFDALAKKINDGVKTSNNPSVNGQNTTTGGGNNVTQNNFYVNGQSGTIPAQTQGFMAGVMSGISGMQDNGYLTPTQSQSASAPVNKTTGTSNGFGELTNLYF